MCVFKTKGTAEAWEDLEKWGAASCGGEAFVSSHKSGIPHLPTPQLHGVFGAFIIVFSLL